VAIARWGKCAEKNRMSAEFRIDRVRAACDWTLHALSISSCYRFRHVDLRPRRLHRSSVFRITGRISIACLAFALHVLRLWLNPQFGTRSDASRLIDRCSKTKQIINRYGSANPSRIRDARIWKRSQQPYGTLRDVNESDNVTAGFADWRGTFSLAAGFRDATHGAWAFRSSIGRIASCR